MKIYFISTLLMQAAILLAVFRGNRRVIMTITEYADAVATLATQLNKALAEILHSIEVGQTVSQADIDKLTAAQTAAQALDDLNPDV